MARATSGPSMAPALSRARCTPKAVARPSGRLLSEMSTSRGTARAPLAARSNATTPAMSGHEAPAASMARRDTAEAPYPARAISFERPVRSTATPLASRSSAVTPW